MAEAPRPAAPMNTVRPMTPEEIRLAEHAEQARIVAEVAERNATEVVPGGVYIVGDQRVNAEGLPLKDKKD